ncbi:MAG: sulfatase [Acidobacteriota bacterium]
MRWAGTGCWLLLTACVFGACGPGEQPPDRLLLATAGPQPVEWVSLAGSERRAVTATDGVAWRGEVILQPGDALDFSLALVPGAASGVSAEAVVETASGRELARWPLSTAGSWQEQRLDLPLTGRHELVLRSVGAGTVAWAELSLLRRPSPAVGGERPNLILISLDTVRADHLSLYGYHRPTSPSLEALAASSWVFEQSFSTSTWTLPSHGSMFTGLLPDQHGLQRVADRLAPNAETAAERLAADGYRTAAITDGGFLGSRWGFAQGFERYDSTSGQAWEPKDAAVIFRRAAEWVAANRHRPFFLFVHTYEAHQPYFNREGFADPFLDPDYRGPFEQSANVFRKDVDLPAEVERITALYDGGLRRMDHYLGRFLDDLEARGVLDSTALIVTSDHGEGLNEHGDFEHAHGEVFDEHVRVPLLVRPAGGVSAARVATPVTSLDVLPTLLDFAGLEDPGLLGGSLRRLAEAPSQPSRAVLSHGINSLQELFERRYRLGEGDSLVIFDRPRQALAGFQPSSDPEMRRPQPPSPDDPAARRLGRLLAWLGEGDYWTCFEAGRRLTWVDGAALAVAGHWSGEGWQSGPAPAELSAAPGQELCVSFEILPGQGPRAVEVDGRRLRLRRAPADTSAAASPLVSDQPLLPSSGDAVLVWPTAAAFEAERTTLDEAATEELRALGYLG